MAVGDVSLQTGCGLDPFSEVRSFFSRRDVLFGNLEVALSTRGRRVEKAVVLVANPSVACFLKESGFDLMSVANNHTTDLGIDGLRDTLETLDRLGIKHIGASTEKNAPLGLVIRRSQMKIGVLAYTTGYFIVPRGVRVNKIIRRRIVSDIKSIGPTCDVIIVSLHWGTENSQYPSPQQIELAHELIDRGAALVIGHGSHVVQGVERYGRGLIAYSLGNFNFDPVVSRTESNLSMILSVELNKWGVCFHEIIPVEIDENQKPRLIEGERIDEALTFVSSLSEMVASGAITRKWWFGQIADKYVRDSFASFRLRIAKSKTRPIAEFLVWCVMPFSIQSFWYVARMRFRKWLRCPE